MSANACFYNFPPRRFQALVDQHFLVSNNITSTRDEGIQSSDAFEKLEAEKMCHFFPLKMTKSLIHRLCID